MELKQEHAMHAYYCIHSVHFDCLSLHKAKRRLLVASFIAQLLMMSSDLAVGRIAIQNAYNTGSCTSAALAHVC